ncbi:Vacuolar protein sorting-associated protein 13C [Chelonia mydas]|uniref:Vacuolar protein sorting-associated protein 13C n=1 Tax=Chelonia mydas TaxID=8469 RepID=M7AXS7_CHEMY|nr:Vacuolar protein sorting-associated protein 13C [Chelonia mydas]
MVLESVVADLLNRFLGDYVENLNKSQLKLGIWGGNVALDNLQIKENALSELDVPFKVKVGQIDKLTLKIPWKNLYGEAVVATLEGLYLLIVPGASIKYDVEKEEKYLQDNKQKELSRIEEALQKSAEKDKPKAEKKDTFLEKLATQVIKNVQVKITGIHVKYEDDTANENWTPSILNEAAKIIYKDQLKRGVPSGSNQPKNYQYIFRPVSASAKLYINPHAETELKTPKLDWNIEVQNIVIEFTKPQYLSMIDLLESIDYMVRNVPYRKYRPDVPLHKNAKEWWKYAANSILEVHIRRCTRMWSWSNMKHHRQLLKSYKNIYKNKLTQSKLSEETRRQIQDLERALDIFNIILARQQAQVEVIRSGQKLLRKKSADGEKKGGGWFSGFWGKKESRKKEDEESPVPETIDDLMTPEEKAKLFTAIGYSDSSHNLTLPKKYVAHVMTLKLLSTSLTIKEDKDVPETLKVQIIDLSTKISQRPGAQALKVEAKLEHWYVTGLKQQSIVPSLVASIGDTKSSLLKIVFETNPEDSTADQSLIVESQPVEIIYDAKTINAMVEFFQTSKGMDLERLTSATLMKLEEIKERTATGLAHIIETRKVLDLKINLKPSYLVVPQTGFHNEKSDLLILDFGTFQFTSVNQGGHQSSSFSSLEEIMDKAYDTFDVEIKNVQLLFGRREYQYIFERPGKIVRFKVSGGLPLVHVRLSDQKIKGIFDLIDSIPFPEMSAMSVQSTKVPAIPTVTDVRKGLLDTSILLEGVESESDEYFDAENSFSLTEKALPEGHDLKNKTEAINEEFIDLQLKFEIKEACLGTEATVRTYDLTAVSYLKKISLDYHKIQDKKRPLHLISSSDGPGLDLLKVEYIKADKNGPKFQSSFDNTEQTLQVAFSSLNFLLHTQALLSTINFLTSVIPSSSPSAGDIGHLQTQGEKQQKDTSVKKVVTKTAKDKEVIDFKLFAKLDAFCLNVCDEKNNIAEIKIQGVDSSLILQPSHTVLFARLKDIIVTDVDSRTIHKKAVSIVGDEVFSFNLALYPDATEGEAYTDMSKVDGIVSLKVGCIQIVYLHKFLMSLLNFLNNFQTAKEALSAATVQAAEKAATSVKDLAERSLRLSMDIHLKAPVIIIPQSSVSDNAVLIDLGLIRVQNKFSLVPAEGCSLPPVIDKMDVQLTKLKLSRTIIQPGFSQPDIQILHPINLNLSVNRNLAATWYHKIPMLEIKGHLDTMNVILSQEDLNVLLKVLTENLGEADEMLSKAKPIVQKEGKIKGTEIPLSTQNESTSGESLPGTTKVALREDVTNMLLNFEIKEVVVTLMRQMQKEGHPLHILTVLQLGTETRIGNHDMTATAYLNKITLKCLEFTGNGASADADGPDFTTTYKNTKQAVNVSFSSLDLILHTEALLSIMNFVTYSVPSGGLASSDKGFDPKPQREEQKSTVLKAVSSGAAHEDVYDLKLTVKLNAFNVFVCDQKCNIADIKIQGMDASVSMKTKKIKVFSRLEDIIITNVDPKTIHKKAVSIVGEEVFRFKMVLYPNATEGEDYTDMSKVDGKMCLKVGCIQIVYLHKFFMSLLNFLNNFQAAKEALSAATVQAAEMAASSMKDFAKKSFRLSMDINLKAPVLVIPESSVSHNALVADLGLIRVQNEFKLDFTDKSSVPPVIDNMDVQLTHLKLSRSIIPSASQPDVEILQPVNLVLSVQRNLAAAWYHDIPAIGIKGDLKPMQIAVSEDDLTVLMKILLDNLGDASSQSSATQQTLQEAQKTKKEKDQSDSHLCEDPGLTSGQTDISALQPPVEYYSTLKFDFNFESLSIVLYINDRNEHSLLSLHSDNLRLGELRLHLMASSGKMFSDGSMDVNIKLKTCTLDDLREGIQKVTARMIDKKYNKTDNYMIDINYKQDTNGIEVVAILDKLYVCASVEFLLTVADFFIKSMPTASTERSTQVQLKHAPGKPKHDKEGSLRPNMTVKAVVLDPEIVFVANLTKADAPALKASFQCDFSLSSDKLAQRMTAQVKDVKVLACAFLREKQDKNITTISPIILNTVMTIMAAIKPKAKEEDSKGTTSDSGNLWDVKPINQCNAWFLGVDVAMEATETFTDSEHALKNENFDVGVKSVQITLECGLGHRTVPLLLIESAFSGTLKNWSSLLGATADLTLEVHYYNETYAVWEPLIERIDGGRKPWNLKLEIKTNPVQDKSLIPGDDFIVLPEAQTVVNISSKDTMNITISKCCLAVFNNLAKAFSEGTASTFDYSLKDRAPFTVKNALGVPLKVHPNINLRVVGSTLKEDIHDVEIGQKLELEYSVLEPLHRGKLSALYRQESCLFTLSLGYTEVANIPIAKPGRRLHSVRTPLVDHSDSVLVQIDAAEGNKVITIRSPLQGTAEAHELLEGSAADVLHSRISGEIMELVLIKYQGKNWNGHFRVHDELPEFFPVCFTSNSTDTMTIDIYVHVRQVGSRMILSVFSPYWIINKTSRVLQYRAEDIHVKHPADYRDTILFSFKKRNIFSKNKIQLCISTSSWSTSFSLDTVGSYGCVKCPGNDRDYLVGVSIKMSSFNLTRIVTLTPFYTIANNSSLELEVGEIKSNGSLPTRNWNYFSSSECLPFWPENLSGKLCVRVVGCESASKPFFCNTQDNGTLLSLEELNGGILVNVNISENSTVINFSDYHEGAAPALIINQTPWDTLKYKQSGLQDEMELKPKEVRLFAWADPTGIRKLTWTYAQNVGEHDLLKDECGQFPYNSNTQIHWVSFLDGRQRVLLFTDDVALVSKARQAEEMEQPDQEINLSLHSLGLSLVNNESKQEIAYIGITSSGVVWELKPKQRWKPFNQKQINLLEKAYQKYLSTNTMEDLGWVKIDNNFEVDNQLPGPMFPVVFHPVAPPKSIALDSEPKPFIDISIITRFNEYSKVLQFKYFMVLIQEMALKLDQGFLGALIGLFTPSTDPEAERQRTKLIQQDIDALNTELMESSLTDMSTLSFFEHFHISPIKVAIQSQQANPGLDDSTVFASETVLHLSLSLGSGGEESDKDKKEMIAIHSVNLLLKSIGATLTDVDDLIFKLAFFEIKYQFYRQDELIRRVVTHYSEQFLKQMYVLVLGLDVLGNPFGLIRGLSEGVEAFFYEPFQGAVQGPEEFAEGFVIGVKSLLGHTVGGAAGVVSRITGSVGKGLAAITMDKEYQQKRREEMGRQPKDFGDSLAKGGKGFLRGIVGGVTGIITKPVEGAKKEGAAGFFKGVGKGLVGVVARPTGGIVDMASSTFQGIQRVAESTEEVSSLRPPRHIHEDGIIRPYDRREAEGYDLFQDQGLLMFQKKDHAAHECLKKIQLEDETTAKRICRAVDEAQAARQQQKLVKKASLKLIKPQPPPQ